MQLVTVADKHSGNCDSLADNDMAQIITDAEINDLLSDRKAITSDQVRSLKKVKVFKNRRDKHSEVSLSGESGKIYLATVRQSAKLPMDYSVILSLSRQDGSRTNLIRCNGHHGVHFNALEKHRIPAGTCHIHQITERYQNISISAPERYAVATLAYTDLKRAIDYFAEHFGMYIADDGYAGGLFRDLV
jgi:hypothetical protein